MGTRKVFNSIVPIRSGKIQRFVGILLQYVGTHAFDSQIALKIIDT